MKVTIQDAVKYPRTMGAQAAIIENIDVCDDDLIVRSVEIAMERKDDLTRAHVEQAVTERKAEEIP